MTYKQDAGGRVLGRWQTSETGVARRQIECDRKGKECVYMYNPTTEQMDAVEE